MVRSARPALVILLGSEGVDELALHQFLECFGMHRALSEHLRRRRKRLTIGADADVELGANVDAQTVERDQRIPVAGGSACRKSLGMKDAPWARLP